MHVGELERLTWGDVDEPRGRWRVSQVVAKTRRGRWVNVPPVVFGAVLKLCPRDDRSPARRVFQGFGADRFRTAISRACVAAGVPVFSPHDLRHRRISPCTSSASRGPESASRSVNATSPLRRTRTRMSSATRPSSTTRESSNEPEEEGSKASSRHHARQGGVPRRVRSWALVRQAQAYVETYGTVFPSSSSTDAQEQALLEAVLVHVRLLNEFLASTGWHSDDARADDWPGWTGKPFLGPIIRRRINPSGRPLSRSDERTRSGTRFDTWSNAATRCLSSSQRSLSIGLPRSDRVRPSLLRAGIGRELSTLSYGGKPARSIRRCVPRCVPRHRESRPFAGVFDPRCAHSVRPWRTPSWCQRISRLPAEHSAARNPPRS